jgi:hypothetical protein
MSLFGKLSKDKDGNIVLLQSPNLPIITYIVSLILSKVTAGSLQQFFEVIGFGSLFVFAWLELFEGVNYFRKALGLVVMLFLIASRVGN